MIDETIEDEGEDRKARRWYPVSAGITVCLALLCGTAITWNALYNQRPQVAAANARTIELKAKPPAPKVAQAVPAPQPKPAVPVATGAKAEIAVDADSAPAGKGDAAGSQTIAALQAELAKLGYYAGAANGQIDADTKAAVDRYRAQNDLDPSVSYEDVLDHARFAAQIVEAANYAPAKTQAAAPATQGTSEGAAVDHDQIVFVQKGLSELGYAPGPADGHLGDITKRAIRDFQAERHLPITGDITPELIAELKKTSGLTTFLTRP